MSAAMLTLVQVASLRRKAVAEKEQLEEFMKTGSELFGRQAASVEDIGKSGQEARSMVDGLGSIAQVSSRVLGYNSSLSTCLLCDRAEGYLTWHCYAWWPMSMSFHPS